MIFLVLSGKMFFFPRKHDLFSLGGKWEAIFLKKYVEMSYFFCTCTDVTNVAPRPSVKKNQRQSYPAKIHLKVIDILHWDSRKSASNSLYFHGNLYRRVLPSCSALVNLIYRIEVWLLLQFIWLEIFYNEQSLILCTIQPSGVVFGGVFERQSRKNYFPLGDGL